MAFVIADRVKETSTTTGTGALTLAGAATAFRTFASRMAVGDTCYYAIQAVDAFGAPTGDWEVGLGTYSGVNTLTRTTVTASSNADAAVSFAAGTKEVYITLPAAQASWMREKLTAARTYYVRSDGSDTNTGLTDTAGGAFLTTQKAIDTVASLDMSTHQVTIQLGDGAYTARGLLKRYIGELAPIIKGNAATPANVHVNISTASTSAFSTLLVDAVPTGISGPGMTWIIKDLKITSTRAALECYGAGNSILYSNIDFGVCTTFHVLASHGGVIQAIGDYSISGGTGWHLFTTQGGLISIPTRTATVLANIAISTFAYALRTGVINTTGSSFSIGAFTVTGTRYLAELNGVIFVNGAGASHFPGTVAGSTATGGQYA